MHPPAVEHPRPCSQCKGVWFQHHLTNGQAGTAQCSWGGLVPMPALQPPWQAVLNVPRKVSEATADLTLTPQHKSLRAHSPCNAVRVSGQQLALGAVGNKANRVS